MKELQPRGNEPPAPPVLPKGESSQGGLTRSGIPDRNGRASARADSEESAGRYEAPFEGLMEELGLPADARFAFEAALLEGAPKWAVESLFEDLANHEKVQQHRPEK